MSRTRRQFVGDLAIVAAASMLPRALHAVRSERPRGPRALIHILLYGGLDATLTTDAKVRADVEPEIDLPYGPEGLLRVGDTVVGPYLEPLGRHLAKLAILNGVVCSTVAHQTGVIQLQQMRRVYPANGIGLTGTLGALRGRDMPVADVRFLYPYPPMTSQPASGRTLTINWGATMNNPDDDLLRRLSILARDPRGKVLGELLGDELAHCSGARCLSLDVVHALLERMPAEALPHLPAIASAPFGAPDLPPPSPLSEWAGILRDTLFLLEHQLTPAVFIFNPINWDSHAYNRLEQLHCMWQLAPALNYLFDELERRRTPAGTRLADEVGVVISSELGRFPVKNRYEGKDHFPEFPVIMMGPGLRPGVYGETDRRMIATPISLKSGRPSHGAGDVVPTIDDVGATILRWFGIEDTASLGYTGRNLDFLLA